MTLSSIVLAMSSAASATEDQSRFTFASKADGIWRFEAITEIANPPSSSPHIRDITCNAAGPDGEFSMDGRGRINWFSIQFLGKADADGDRHQITLLGDRLWLFVDGEKFEFANIPLRNQFSNVDYAPSEGEIILTWRGHQAVRKRGVGPWIHFSRLEGQLLSAKKVEWGFKSRNWKDVGEQNDDNRLPSGWQRRRYTVNIEALRRGVDWCNDQIASDAAFRLPPEHLKSAVR